jgi:transposase
MSGAKGKNDAADAAAICEAVERPQMRFVSVKSIEQQGQMMAHRVRQAARGLAGVGAGSRLS